MNVFEDLIEELKDEDLLEETVIRRSSKPAETPMVPEPFQNGSATLHGGPSARPGPTRSAAPEVVQPSTDRFDSYKKRVMDEVSGLQVVEHVLSGIEREYLKMSPGSYDDLPVKKSLHKVLQVSEEADSREFAEAEYSLMHAIQEWFSALAKRDSNLSVADLRRFCENSRPVLSSQALMALARFYRNSPFSEPVRGKFDFVITRLFSRQTDEGQRKPLFVRSEAIGHIWTFYANWSSLDLHSGAEHADRLGSIVRGFDSFASEASTADSFDELIASDLFNRIQIFKEETGEYFFAPDVTAAAIDCNVQIGNRFVELLHAARDAESLDLIEAKYGHSYDNLMSTAASRTLQLVEILKGERELPTVHEAVGKGVSKVVRAPVPDFERAPVEEGHRRGVFAVNKWLLAAVVLVLMAAGAVLIWSERAVESQGDIEHARTVEISDPELKQHLRMALASSETMYGVAQPSWDSRTEEEQRELLRRAWAVAEKIKMKQVNITNYKGRTVAYASKDKIELLGR